MNNGFKKRLLSRIAIFFILTTIISVIVGGYLFIVFLKLKIFPYMNSSLDQISWNINYFINQKIQKLELTSMNLKTFNDLNFSSIEKLSNELLEFDEIGVIFENGTMLTSNMLKVDVSEKDFFKYIFELGNSRYISGLYTQNSSNFPKMFIVLSKMVNNKKIAIYAEFNASQIISRLITSLNFDKEYIFIQDGKYSIWLFDKSGKILKDENLENDFISLSSSQKYIYYPIVKEKNKLGIFLMKYIPISSWKIGYFVSLSDLIITDWRYFSLLFIPFLFFLITAIPYAGYYIDKNVLIPMKVLKNKLERSIHEKDIAYDKSKSESIKATLKNKKSEELLGALNEGKRIFSLLKGKLEEIEKEINERLEKQNHTEKNADIINISDRIEILYINLLIEASRLGEKGLPIVAIAKHLREKSQELKSLKLKFSENDFLKNLSVNLRNIRVSLNETLKYMDLLKSMLEK